MNIKLLLAILLLCIGEIFLEVAADKDMGRGSRNDSKDNKNNNAKVEWKGSNQNNHGPGKSPPGPNLNGHGLDKSRIVPNSNGHGPEKRQSGPNSNGHGPDKKSESQKSHGSVVTSKNRPTTDDKTKQMKDPFTFEDGWLAPFLLNATYRSLNSTSKHGDYNPCYEQNKCWCNLPCADCHGHALIDCLLKIFKLLYKFFCVGDLHKERELIKDAIMKIIEAFHEIDKCLKYLPCHEAEECVIKYYHSALEKYYGCREEMKKHESHSDHTLSEDLKRISEYCDRTFYQTAQSCIKSWDSTCESDGKKSVSQAFGLKPDIIKELVDRTQKIQKLWDKPMKNRTYLHTDL